MRSFGKQNNHYIIDIHLHTVTRSLGMKNNSSHAVTYSILVLIRIGIQFS